MIQEEKQLLLKDLCGRLPYGVHLFTNSKNHIRLLTISHDIDYDEQYWINGLYDIDEIKPYLRPMESMTEEERETFNNIPMFKSYYILKCDLPWEIGNYKVFDWLNKNHFDYRGLIPKGLAIAVTEDNNPYKE